MDEYIEAVTESDLDALALGTSVLASGGGGQPRIGLLHLQRLFQQEAYPDRVEIVDPDSVAPDATITSVGQIGAPTIGSEKIPSGTEEVSALHTLEEVSGQSIDALVPGEIGGANSFAPLIAALQTGLPVVDADAMGRALPELQMDTFFINGKQVDFALLVDEKSNSVVFRDIDSPKRFEQLARAVTVELGGTVGHAYPLLDGEIVSEFAVPHTLSLCRKIGRVIQDARNDNVDPTRRVCAVADGEEVFSGKVSEVERRHDDGFTTGSVEITQRDGGEYAPVCTLEFQNEFIRVMVGDHTVGTVPDLITLLDAETGKPILTDEVQFGQRVDVICIPAPDPLTTETALAVVGPRAFGFEETYIRFEDRRRL